MTEAVSFSVNNREITVRTDRERPLLEVLREDLGLTGPKYGCGEGRCGACGVLLDGRRIFSCSTPVESVRGRKIVTVEGLCDGERLHPVQQAFFDADAFQCGYCTSGMIVAAVSLLNSTPEPDEEKIRSGMNGNLCRCCAYPRIFSAVRSAARREVR